MILGASFDTVEENRAFAEKFDFPYRLLCDTERTLGRAYGATASDEGNPARISYLIGPDGIITHVWKVANAADHPQEVLAALGAP